MEAQWGSHGTLMKAYFGFCGSSMEAPWKLYGRPVEGVWEFYGICTEALWEFCGCSMGILWGCIFINRPRKLPWKHGGSNVVGALRELHEARWRCFGSCLGAAVWALCGRRMGALRGHCGNLMGALWIPHGIEPLIFEVSRNSVLFRETNENTEQLSCLLYLNKVVTTNMTAATVRYIGNQYD